MEGQNNLSHLQKAAAKKKAANTILAFRKGMLVRSAARPSHFHKCMMLALLQKGKHMAKQIELIVNQIKFKALLNERVATTPEAEAGHSTNESTMHDSCEATKAMAEGVATTPEAKAGHSTNESIIREMREATNAMNESTISDLWEATNAMAKQINLLIEENNRKKW